jgi:hypothetical protein
MHVGNGKNSLKVGLKATWDSIPFYAALLAIAAFGAYLRLYQFTQQVLLDDEWHAVHQLLWKTPAQMFLTFGQADYSIPLALFYWFEQRFFGLSETLMRWPMMAAGLVSLVLFPLYIRRYFDKTAVLIFTALLATSPLLVIYSRTARPYALTLLLSMMAVGCFHRFMTTEKPDWRPGILYVLCMVSSTWLHLISLPITVAPFLTFGIPALIQGRRDQLRRMLGIGIVCLIGVSALVLPPVFAHPEALGGKLGAGAPGFQTFGDLVYFWSGTSSPVIAVTASLLALAGANDLWRRLPLTRSLLAGLGLSLALILISRPAWVQHTLTLARYLLPAVPLFLLAVALGTSRLIGAVRRRWERRGGVLAGAALLSGLLLASRFSPLWHILEYPNSNSLHSVFQFDFRQDRNLIYQFQSRFPVSPFWRKLAALPRGSVKIAASPFYFETYLWDAPRWEQISHQRVFPGYLDGLCAKRRWGEVPRGRGFDFRNAGYLADPADLVKRGFDLVVFQKPFSVMTDHGKIDLGEDTKSCYAILLERMPPPIYEDKWLIVFPLSADIAGQFNAE